MICGGLPLGFELGTPPGDSSAYPDVCERAIQVFSKRQDIVGWPDIDLTTCYVVATSSYPGEDPNGPDYHVSFETALLNGEHVTLPLNTDG